jgi:hypothetical protein
VKTDGLSVSLSDLTLQNGTASSVIYDGSVSGGGNLACQASSDVYLSGVTLTGGTAGLGGGLYLEVCNLDMEDSAITANDAESTGGFAGGMFLYDSGSAVITDSSIDNNVASYAGAAFIYGSTNLDLEDTIVTDNEASLAGGGMLVDTTDSGSSAITCTGDSSGTYGFVNNVGSGPAIWMLDYPVTFQATECDFGTLADGTSNDEYGLYYGSSDWLYNLGNDATFYCDQASGCGVQEVTDLGTSSNNFYGDDRMRGNVFLATAEGTIDEFGLQLDPDSSCTLDYYVMSNSSVTSTGWSVEYANTGNSVSGGGDDLYQISEVGLGLKAGTYYAVGVGWNCSTSGHRVGYANNSSTTGDLIVGTHEGNIQSTYTSTLSGTGVSISVYSSSIVYDGSVTATEF